MALTLSGGTTVGNAQPAATIKPVGCQRVQFDATGTYATGGYADFTTFIRTILGTRITPVAVSLAKPGGAYNLYWDKTNDKLMVYVGSTQVEVGDGVAVTLTNAELDVWFR